MTPSRFHGCALVTGASAGLGAEFARQLAPACETLVLVARRREPMEALAEEIRRVHPVLRIAVFDVDLTDPDARDVFLSRLEESGLHPDLLVNNAGMGDYGEFAGAEWLKLEAMIRLNVETLTAMAHALVPGMVAKGGGSVINVSSLACMLPIPDFAVYAATKAYVTSFSEAIRLELREHNIHVTAVCPGPVHTEFGQVAQRTEVGAKEASFRESFYLDARRVVAEGLRALAADRARVFPGWKIAGAAAFLAIAPMALVRLGMSIRPRR